MESNVESYVAENVKQTCFKVILLWSCENWILHGEKWGHTAETTVAHLNTRLNDHFLSKISLNFTDCRFIRILSTLHNILSLNLAVSYHRKKHVFKVQALTIACTTTCVTSHSACGPALSYIWDRNFKTTNSLSTGGSGSFSFSGTVTWKISIY